MVLFIFISVACITGTQTSKEFDTKTGTMCVNRALAFISEFDSQGCGLGLKEYLPSNDQTLYNYLCGGEESVFFSSSLDLKEPFNSESLKILSNDYMEFTFYGEFALIKHTENSTKNSQNGDKLTIGLKNSENNCFITYLEIR